MQPHLPLLPRLLPPQRPYGCVLPQGLCTCWSLWLERSSVARACWLSPSILSEADGLPPPRQPSLSFPLVPRCSPQSEIITHIYVFTSFWPVSFFKDFNAKGQGTMSLTSPVPRSDHCQGRGIVPGKDSLLLFHIPGPQGSQCCDNKQLSLCHSGRGGPAKLCRTPLLPTDLSLSISIHEGSTREMTFP